MTPNELYSSPVEKAVWDLEDLEPWLDEYGIHYVDPSLNDRVTVHRHKDWHIDHHRVWRLSSVRLDGVPVCILQLGGRSGKDHTARFITNLSLWYELVGYLRSLISDTEDEVPSDEDIPHLDEFQGLSLSTTDWDLEKVQRTLNWASSVHTYAMGVWLPALAGLSGEGAPRIGASKPSVKFEGQILTLCAQKPTVLELISDQKEEPIWSRSFEDSEEVHKFITKSVTKAVGRFRESQSF